MAKRTALLAVVTLLGCDQVGAQIYTTGSIHCTVDAFTGFVNCSSEQTSVVAKPLYEVILESATAASAIEKNRAIADAMRAQAELLRTRARDENRAQAMDRVVALIGSADKIEGEARATLLNMAAEELRKLYPTTSFPAGSTVLVPMSNDGWDRLACQRMKTQLSNVFVYQGTFEDAPSIPGVKLLVVNMMPDPNHDTMEAFLVDAQGRHVWTEKVGWAWTLNFERQTIKLADRMASKIKGRI